MTQWRLYAVLAYLMMITVPLVFSRALARRRAREASRALWSAVARRESFAEIVSTVDRLTREWNASDRIDLISA